MVWLQGAKCEVQGGKWVVGAGGEHVSLAVNGSHVAFLSFRK